MKMRSEAPLALVTGGKETQRRAFRAMRQDADALHDLPLPSDSCRRRQGIWRAELRRSRRNILFNDGAATGAIPIGAQSAPTSIFGGP
jgi:hypothetical protein